MNYVSALEVAPDGQPRAAGRDAHHRADEGNEDERQAEDSGKSKAEKEEIFHQDQGDTDDEYQEIFHAGESGDMVASEEEGESGGAGECRAGRSRGLDLDIDAERSRRGGIQYPISNDQYPTFK
jgi:hypothetical protein